MTTVMGIKNDDFDRPLYRIFPLCYFKSALSEKRLTLVRPTVWEDPHEDICEKGQMSAKNFETKRLLPYLQPAFAQSWSLDGDSDALLRAYSRVIKDESTKRNIEQKYEGVQVKTTVRKLLGALATFSNSVHDKNFEFYLGSVKYVENPAQEITNGLNSHGPKVLGEGYGRAQSLLLKRLAYRHESEVRIVVLSKSQTDDKLFNLNIDPNKLFERVKFDPRLVTSERLEREKQAKELGYHNDFEQSFEYQYTLFTMVMTKHWNEFP